MIPETVPASAFARLPEATFRLDESFIKKYQSIPPPWGFGVLSDLVYRRTYSRIKENGENEVWWETIRRVVEGTYRMQERYIKSQDLGWNESRAQRSARDMYDRAFHLKWLPGGRGLWAMGSPLTEERGLFAALLNCACVSTENLDKEFTQPFEFLMDLSMLGVGVGFDVRGAGKIGIKKPSPTHPPFFMIPDSREGWVASVKQILEAYFFGSPVPRFDYSRVRPEGLPIKGFGGVTSGPEPLKRLHQMLIKTLDRVIGKPISSRTITDIMNMIALCVVSGNVRRSALIAFGEADDPEYLDLKNYHYNAEEKKWEGPAAERANYGWTSNNSILAKIGMNYGETAERVRGNGEPGFLWLENVHTYGRMGDPPDYRDRRVKLTNPCQPGFAPILTPEGIKQLDQVGEGDFIWSEMGWTRIKKKWSTGIQPVYRYVTTAGSFVGTEDHRIVSEGEKVAVCEAETIDILPGYRIDEIPAFHAISIMDGLVLGDGTVHRASNNLVYLCVGEKDQDYFQDEILSPLFLRDRPGLHPGAWEVKTRITADELPKTYEREIPEYYLLGDFQTVCSFLRGIYSANGSLCGDRVTLKSASRKIVEQVQLMLSGLGIASWITTNKSHIVAFSNGDYSCRQSYDLNIGSGRNDFNRLIGFIQKYKQEKLIEICNRIGGSKYSTLQKKKSYEIREIEYLDEFEVFDITVDNETHTYWTGGLNVSNCGEQVLESAEACNLVEIFLNRHETGEDFERTIKHAYLYGKTVTLARTHWQQTNKVMLRNRRIGCSISGVQQFIAAHGLDELRRWCERGYEAIKRYDHTYSEWFCVPQSIRCTTVKPSGTISLLAGATPGMHWPESLYYIRRMRLSKNSDLVGPLVEAGYVIEPCIGNEETAVIVEIPVALEGKVHPVHEISMWEQLSMAAFLQRYWSDNAVSVTVSFDPDTEGDQIERALDHFQTQLKTVSFLPKPKTGSPYPQLPYEPITEEQYQERIQGLKPLNFNHIRGEEAEIEKFCSNDRCQLP